MNKEMDEIIKEIQGSMQESYHGKPEEAEDEKTDETVDTDTQTDLEDEAEDENVEETDSPNDTDDDVETDEDTSTTDTDNDNSDGDVSDYLVEIQGKKYTEQELLDIHSNGLRQADYSKKTAELAEQRKAFEAEKERAIADLRAEYEQKLEKVTKYLPEPDKYTVEELEKMAVEDYYKFESIKAQREARKLIEEDRQKLQQEQLNRKADEETAKLRELEPAFKNNFEESYKKTLEHMVANLGYTQDEALSVIDARTIKSHYDSMMYSSGANLAKKKVKVLGKSSGNQAKEKPPTATKTRAKQINSISTRDDLAALIEQDIAS